MEQFSTLHVGLDVYEDSIDIATADPGRQGEVRHGGSIGGDLYGYRFYVEHVPSPPWTIGALIKPPKVRRLPDIVTVAEARRLFAAPRTLSLRALFFTLYSLGLRLGKGLSLTVADIDAAHMRVHIRDAKGQRDRFVPLPAATLAVLSRFWAVHRNPTLLFPRRTGGAPAAALATAPLNRAGVQRALRQVCLDIGLKETSTPTACATATPPTWSKPGCPCWSCRRSWATTAS